MTLFSDDGRQLIWNSTSLGIAKDCKRKYFYSIIEGWCAKDQNDHLLFGGRYAQALETYHRLRSALYRLDHDNALNQVIHEALKASWGWQSTDSRKTRETLIRSIVWYLEEFKDDPCKTVELKDGSPAVELNFQFKFSEDITFAGHLDRLVSYGDDYYIQDQKTTGSTLSANYFKRYTPDNQMSLYTVAGQIIWALPIKGVMIDAAQIAVGFTRFERGFAFRTEEQCDEWLEDAVYHIEETWRAQRWPMNDQACSKWGGCQFLQVCSKAPAVRQLWLEANFVRKPFNPLRTNHA